MRITSASAPNGVAALGLFATISDDLGCDRVFHTMMRMLFFKDLFIIDICLD